MKDFPIRQFRGIETKVESSDQTRGTLRKAIGVITAPTGALSSGPAWRRAWDVVVAVEGVLGAADATKVHFVTITRDGNTFLMAWDLAARIAVGIWFIGTGEPDFLVEGSAPTYASPNNSTYRNKTAGLPWYGTWIGNTLWLGNGTDINLIWKAGSLNLLGPASTPADVDDPSQARFPPCKAYVQREEGTVLAAGNATNPLRVWEGERPTTLYPLNEGIKNAERSFTDIRGAKGTAVTALSLIADQTVAHLDQGGVVVVGGPDSASDGTKMGQSPIALNAGAMNPNCVRDTKTGPYYFGADCEVYSPRIMRYRTSPHGRNRATPRDHDLATDRSSGVWNADLKRPQPATAPFIVYDLKSDRVWLWAQMTQGGRNALFCYDGRTSAITGPILYPDLTCVTAMYKDEAAGFSVVGVTRDGALLYADLWDVGEQPLGDYNVALAAQYLELATAPAPTVGFPYVGVSSDGQRFMQVMNLKTLVMSSPWDDLAELTPIIATKFFANASLAMFEIRDEDFGSPDTFKEFLQVRLQLPRNTRAYFGIYGESEGRRVGKWRGTWYPKTEVVSGLGISGRRLTLRVVVVYFNDAQFLLSGLTVNYQPSVAS